MHFRLSATFIALMALCGCSALKSPQDEAQIRAEMAKLPLDKPGRYASHYEIGTFSMRGIPDSRAEIVKREIEGRGRLGQVSCFGAADVKTDRYEALRHFDGASCKIVNFTSDGTNFEATLKCKYGGGVDADITMSGVGAGEIQPYQFEVSGTSKLHPDFALSYSGKGEFEYTGTCPRS